MNVAFAFDVDQRVVIRDAKIEARIVSCIVHKPDDHWYRVLFWDKGERTIIELHVDELDPIDAARGAGL